MSAKTTSDRLFPIEKHESLPDTGSREVDLVAKLIVIRKDVEEGRLSLEQCVQVTSGWLVMLALDHGYEPEELVGLVNVLATSIRQPEPPRLKIKPRRKARR